MSAENNIATAAGSGATISLPDNRLLDKRRRKFLLVVPLIVLPFFYWIFYSLGGGGGSVLPHVVTNRFMGLNTELPGPRPDPKKSFQNKLEAYRKAEEDSMRRKEWLRQDPYRNMKGEVAAAKSGKTILARDVDSVKGPEKLGDLLSRIDLLKKKIREPHSGGLVPSRSSPMLESMPNLERLRELMRSTRMPDTSAADPQLEKLNGMLDKIIRIQHPAVEEKPMQSGENLVGTSHAHAAELMPTDSSGGNAIPAVVAEDQVLVSGATIAFRLPEGASLGGLAIGQDQLIYGIATVSGDRLLVHIQSICNGRSIYNLNMQVYDLDGLPGIRIPGMPSREIAKESAGQGISSLHLENFDPSLTAQAAGVGIQAAKALLDKKVRLTRVSVRAGYKVLLGNNNSFARFHSSPPISRVRFGSQPPGFVPGGSFLSRCRNEGVELGLTGIYVRQDTFWMALRVKNHSPVGFTPQSLRWSIRDRKQFKRTAVQDVELSPVYSPPLMAIESDSIADYWVGLSGFSLGKDKELVCQFTERNAGRLLTLRVREHELIHAKKRQNER